MKHHYIQWAKDYSFGRVACGVQGHGKSTDPKASISNRDAFFYTAAIYPEDCCQYCLRELTKKTPKRALRVAEMATAGNTFTEVEAETNRIKADKLHIN